MDLQQFLLGTLLGDGCIPRKSTQEKHHRYSVAHSEKQECYIRYKHDYLDNFNLVTPKISRNVIKNERYKDGQFTEYRFKSKGHEVFDEYRAIFYPEGHKIVPKEIENLNAEGLAFWFMDDGFRTGRKLLGASFSTEGFSDIDCNNLMQLLHDKWNLKVSRHKAGNIYVYVQSVPKLIDIIFPFIQPCIMYKVLNKLGELQESDGKLICSQVTDASVEGSTTTGGIGSLNNQLERPTPMESR